MMMSFSIHVMDLSLNLLIMQISIELPDAVRKLILKSFVNSFSINLLRQSKRRSMLQLNLQKQCGLIHHVYLYVVIISRVFLS